MRKSTVALAVAMLSAVLFATSGPAAADDVGVQTHLNPWSIDGALFSRGPAGVSGVDIPAACLNAYNEWEELRRSEHQAIIDAIYADYWFMYDANIAAEIAGEDYPYPHIAPPGAEAFEYLLDSLIAQGIPYSVEAWIEEIWEPMEEVPGLGIPCVGKGVLPAPPGGFIGINLGDEPTEPDPCVARGHLPFSPATWEFLPYWHEDAPTDDGGNPISGIQRWYSSEGAKFIFTFIPIVIGVQLQIECLAIFPEEEASRHFEELLPSAELTIVPEAVGATGVDTKLWYDFSSGGAIVGPITVSLSHRGTNWTLSAWAWVDEVGWDLDFDAALEGTPAWDEAIDFPDHEWYPAPDDAYAAMSGSLDEPARVHIYEEKDNYTIATGVSWRGYYVVEEVGDLGWGFTEQYDPVIRWTILPYQVDEIVGRRN